MGSLIIAAIVAGCILLCVLVIRKLRHGGSCCGEHDALPAKIRPADNDLSHYPYRYTAEISGMICTRCVRNAENAFHATGYIRAVVHLDDHTAKLYSKTPLTRRETAQILSPLGFTLTAFKEGSS